MIPSSKLGIRGGRSACERTATQLAKIRGGGKCTQKPGCELEGANKPPERGGFKVARSGGRLAPRRPTGFCPVISSSPSAPASGSVRSCVAKYKTDKSEHTKTASATINQCGYCIAESMALTGSRGRVFVWAGKRHRIRPDCSRHFDCDYCGRERSRHHAEHQVHGHQQFPEVIRSIRNCGGLLCGLF
jgi:hypothetical protein